MYMKINNKINSKINRKLIKFLKLLCNTIKKPNFLTLKTKVAFKFL